MRKKDNIVIKTLLPKDYNVAKKIYSRCNQKNNFFNIYELKGLLEVGEKKGVNNCIGLFYKNKLVGFIIAFKEFPESVCSLLMNKKEISDCINKEKSIFLVNISVDKSYRFLSPSLLFRFSLLINNNTDLKFLKLHCLCNEKWTFEIVKRKKFLRRMGLKLKSFVPLVEDRNNSYYWILFERAEKTKNELSNLEKALINIHSVTENGNHFTVGLVQNYQKWSYLEKYWDTLLESTLNSHVFQEYEFLRIWWMHLGWSGQLNIIVVLRNGIPVAIAPFQIIKKKWLGKTFRVLTYIGLNMEMDRLTVLSNKKNEFSIDLILNYLKAQQQGWDLMSFFEQTNDSVFIQKLRSQFTGTGFLVSCLPGPECAIVNLEQSWEEYLQKKSRNFRKSVRQKEGAIKKTGEVRFQYGLSDPLADGIDDYCRVENQSWKVNAGLGVGKSASHISFYRELMRNYMAKDKAKFSFLHLGNLPISASFGVSRNNTFYSLHICHDERFSSFSPGFVLTAFELRKNFYEKKFLKFDFMGGYLSNKACFSTHIEKTKSAFVARKTFYGLLYHFTNFQIKPILKNLLEKFGVLKFWIKYKNFK